MLIRLILAALLAAAAPAHAQSYPTKPIRIVVPFAPGGGADIIARIIGQKMTDSWGQQVVVDNRAGASGNIGAEIVAKSAPRWLHAVDGEQRVRDKSQCLP